MKVDKYVYATLNRKNVIEAIRHSGPINKAEIARTTNLSIPTVMKLADQFLEDGIIRVTGKGVSSGGKRPELLEFVPDVYSVVGVDIGRHKMKVVVSDLNGAITHKKILETGRDAAPDATIAKLVTLIENTVAQSGVPGTRTLGMGIGMPGLLDTARGVVVFSPDFHWENVNLLGEIKKRFPLPIFLENSNRAQAMGEQWFGVANGAQYFISVNLGHGIGSAIIEGGELYRGSCGTSGELGHIAVERNGPQCDCGNYGCLEVMASGNAIAREARLRIGNDRAAPLLFRANGVRENITAKDVFDAARDGDALSREIVDRAIDYIGIGIATCINLLDPDMIVLAGGLTQSGSILLDGVKNAVKSRQMRFAGRKVRICRGTLGDDATALGAAAMVIKQFIASGCNPHLQRV